MTNMFRLLCDACGLSTREDAEFLGAKIDSIGYKIAVDNICLAGRFVRDDETFGVDLHTYPPVLGFACAHDFFPSRFAVKQTYGKSIYLLHVFQKKSKSGIATPKKDIDLM